MVSTRSEAEFHAAVQAKVEEFKVAFIEEIKSNLKEIFKDEIKAIIKEELCNLEKVSSTVSLLQKHVTSLKQSNIELQKRCSDLEVFVDNNEQYSRRTCLRITNMPCEENESSEDVLRKVKKLITEEAELDIPEAVIDRAHRIGPRKNKKQTAIVKFSTFRQRTLFYRARKKLKNGVKLHINLTKQRFNLLLDAQSFVQGKNNIQYVYADINCNLKIRFRDNGEKIFSSMEVLEELCSE